MIGSRLVMWGLAGALVLAVGAGVLEHLQHAKTRTTLAQERTTRAQEDQQRERLARENTAEMGRLQARHSARQQEILHAHYQRQMARLAADRRDAAGLERLYNLADAYTASRGGWAEGDPAACRPAAAELAELAGLLQEGAGLVAEGRRLLRARDDDAQLWHGLATNDRALTGRE